MAADCMTRVCALAIATVACIGFPGALIYAIVRVAAARRFGATFALAIVLVFWVTVSAAYYPLICDDLLPWSALLARCLPRRRRARPRVVVVVAADSALLPLPAAAERQGSHGRIMGTLPPEPQWPPPVDVDDTLPSFVARRQDYGGMDSLPREPPAARGGARVVGDDSMAARAPDDGEQSRHCAVCLCDVQDWERATWLPACLHMFHEHCINQWVHMHGHSTCPICRCDAFAEPSLPAPPPVCGGAHVVADDTQASSQRQRNGALLPMFVARRRGSHCGGMTALPREPPAAAAAAVRGGARRPAPDDDGGEPSSRRCAVCLYDVEEAETPTWLPACLHMFHQHCIDQWLHLHGHSTCPICRCDAFVAPPLPPEQTV